MPDEQFYDEEGRIKSPDQAQEIAKLEKPARDRELELKKQTETGLTQEQRDNLQIMKGLKEKYPDAFESVIDDKGREVMIIAHEPFGFRHFGDSNPVFTQNGVVYLHLNTFMNIRNIDFTKVMDLIESKNDALKNPREGIYREYAELRKKGAKFEDDVSRAGKVGVSRIELEHSAVSEHLREALKRIQSDSVRYKEETEKFERAKTPEEILKNL
jgi:hypothetical protein